MDNPETGQQARCVLFVTWKSLPGRTAEVAGILRELRQASLSERGCLAFEVYRDRTDDRVFHLYEVYRDMQDNAAHMETGHFKSLVLERALPLLERRERRFCRPLETAPDDLAAGQKGARTDS